MDCSSSVARDGDIKTFGKRPDDAVDMGVFGIGDTCLVPNIGKADAGRGMCECKRTTCAIMPK